jgi:hypothetical protein
VFENHIFSPIIQHQRISFRISRVILSFGPPLLRMSDHNRNDGILFHWKSLLACLVVSLCQFQFGLDSTLIGGFQAMPGFLEVALQPYDKGQEAYTYLNCRYLDIEIPCRR